MKIFDASDDLLVTMKFILNQETLYETYEALNICYVKLNLNLPSIMTGNEGMKRGKPILMLHVYSFRASYSLGSNTVVEVHHRSQLWSPFFPCVTRIHCYAIKNKNRNHTMNKIKNIEHDRLYHLCSYSCARYLKKNILPKFIGLYMGIPYFVMQHEDVN